MKKMILGFIGGLIVGYFINYFNLIPIGSKPEKGIRITAKDDYESIENGERYIKNWNEAKDNPFGTTKMFHINSVGFDQLVKDPNFGGFEIHLGLTKPNDFTTVTFLINGSRINSGGKSEAYYAYEGAERRYLNKILPCPGSPVCPQ